MKFWLIPLIFIITQCASNKPSDARLFQQVSIKNKTFDFDVTRNTITETAHLNGHPKTNRVLCELKETLLPDSLGKVQRMEAQYNKDSNFIALSFSFDNNPQKHISVIELKTCKVPFNKSYESHTYAALEKQYRLSRTNLLSHSLFRHGIHWVRAKHLIYPTLSGLMQVDLSDDVTEILFVPQKNLNASLPQIRPLPYQSIRRIHPHSGNWKKVF